MSSNESWRGNGPVKGTVLNKFEQEDIDFLRANSHLTIPQACKALGVKYGRKINIQYMRTFCETHGITLTKGKKGKQNEYLPSHDTFYRRSEFLAKDYSLAPALQRQYNKETSVVSEKENIDARDPNNENRD